MKIEIAESPDQIRRAWPVVRHLRTHLDEAAFLERVTSQRGRGYRLATLSDDSGEPLAAAGFRIFETLAWGRILYVDDLVTRPEARSKGCGKALLTWLESRARDEGCAELHLDSGTWRKAAHRFYLREGLDLTSHHFARRLSVETTTSWPSAPPAPVGNLLAPAPVSGAGEIFEDVLRDATFRVERIVSTGQATPEGEWLEQDWNEWVLILRGEARLAIDGEDEPRRLGPGDHVLLPARRRHRVEWTTPDEETVWLALHHR